LVAKSPKGLADALSILKAQRATAEKQLENLGAIKGSAKFGEPKLEEAFNHSQRQMQMMLQMQHHPGKNPADDEIKSGPVKVSQSLTVEWSLKSADTANRLLEASTLQEAIKASNLSGLKEAEEQTPEEAELAEEMQNNGIAAHGFPPGQIQFAVPDEDYSVGVGLPNVHRVGDPVFSYVAFIPDADRDKAMANAFQAAKAEASKLCKAAGIQLGALRTLRTAGSPTLSPDDQTIQHVYAVNGHVTSQLMNATSETSEAIGVTPGILKYRVGIVASFSINPVANESAKPSGIYK
jgi:hypothetical protein